ncbi:HlyD family secretion protein [Chitiniphilus shinanonensis]|uniref:HlyD family secretion protein n=1 Tax=Chitiniphilus shinanonensis TaxID=553088 RepID=UPI0030566275
MTASATTRRAAVFLLVIALLALIGYGLWQAYRPAPDQIQGMVDADELRIGAKVPGRLEAVFVHEGDRVKAGQVLFTLSSPELDAKLAQVRAQHAAAESQKDKADNGARPEDIAAARAAWEAAAANAVLAEKTHTRLEALYREGVVTGQRRDEARAARDATAQLAAAARAEYQKAVAGARPEDKAGAAAQTKQAEAGVAEVAALQAELKVVSPAAGEITHRTANVGEIVPPGYPVFTVVDPQDVWVSMNVREDQFHALKLGSELRGTVPALDGRQARFKVSFINPRGEFATWRAVRQSDGYDVRSFEVRARPLAPVDGLRPGMSVLFAWPQ